MPFTDFALSPKSLAGIESMGFVEPTPIQERVIPAALEGRDIIGCAQTGTGKTAAFLIPIIEGLQDMRPAKRYRPKALILSPTRELAIQVHEHFTRLASGTKLRAAVVHGGVEIGPEERAFVDGIDLLVATPGRLLDHLGRGELKFRELEYLVIDETDRLFDGGFLPSLQRILDVLPERRQTMLFSATMPPEMDQFARTILIEPERIQIGLIGPRDQIKESFWPVPEHQKLQLLEQVLATESVEKIIVFVRRRLTAHEILPALTALTKLPSAELHSEISQAQRTDTVEKFRSGEIRLLAATDLAARGLDIDELTHVVNFDVPNTPDDYIHRVGRTGRVDRHGVAITLVSPHDLAAATAIEATLRRLVPHKRLPGFPYEVEEDQTPSLYKVKPRRSDAKPLIERIPTAKKKESPFTSSGKLKRKFEVADQGAEEQPKSRKKMEKRILNKKLPHQKKR